jgi:flagellar basal body-associated protein FliL
MGLNENITSQQIENETITQAMAECGDTSGSNVITMSGVTFDPPPECDDSTLTINQATSVSAECAITQLTQVAVDLANQLTVEQLAAIGININISGTVTSSDIESYVSSICSDATVSNTYIASDVTVNSCDWVIVQDATAEQSCTIDQTQQLISKLSTDVAADQSGSSLLGLIFGSVGSALISIGIVIIIVIVVIGIIVFGIQWAKSKGQKAEAQQSEENEYNNLAADTDIDTESDNDIPSFFGGGGTVSFVWIIIIILVIVLIYVLIRYSGVYVRKSKINPNKMINNNIRYYVPNKYETNNEETDPLLQYFQQINN